MTYRRNLFQDDNDNDPLAGVSNLFDVAMVFAVALLVAAISYMHVGELLSEDDVTIVKNPGKADMEIIKKSGKKIERYKASGVTSNGDASGKKVGTAYQLENGDIIYIPED